MGLFVCSRHGEVGMAFVCRHIQGEIISRKSSAKVIRARFPDDGETDPRYKVNLELNYCLECSQEFNFPEEDGEHPRDQFNSFYGTNVFEASCHKCFVELNNSRD